MIEFVNAKINLGLYVTSRRSDGYHTLETVFYPVGVYNGLPDNPQPFCDMLEITPADGGVVEFGFTGRKVDCELEQNLVVKAARLFEKEAEERDLKMPGLRVILDKHLPDGAGMGGGSADASFTLRMLNDFCSTPFSDEELAGMALLLGADCPFFIYNRPCFAKGIGEEMEFMPLNLGGKWLVAVKPPLSVSTREAFAGITPRRAPFDLHNLADTPVEEWKNLIGNDFEGHLIDLYPELGELKELHYRQGSLYAQMTGSGSVVFGIYVNKESAMKSFDCMRQTNRECWLLKL